MGKERLRVGVIGVGHLGKHHARLYRSFDDVELTAVVDSLGDRAKEIAAAHGSTPFTDFREIFDRVDAVSVAVPTKDHHAIASEFLRRGIPVLVEKPLARTIDEARELVRIAAEHKALLQVGHVERFNPAITATRSAIARPRFIECHRLAPFSFRSTDVDVVMDLMIHDIDIILHLAATPLAKVDAVGVALLFGQEDIANARLEFEDGCVANVTASRVSDKAMRKMRIFSEGSYVSIDFQEKAAMVYRLNRELLDARRPGGGPPTMEDLAALPKEFYDIRDIKMGDVEPLKEELKAFVHAVKTGTLPVVSGEHGLLAMETADRILGEIRGHQWR